jgi:hypothetical protein
MTTKKVILVLFLLILTGGIGIVSAETLTGTLGGSTYAQTNITVAHSGTQTNALSLLAVNSVEAAIGTVALVKFDETSPATFTGPVKSGNSSPFIAKIGSQVVVTGTFGYQRVFNSLGVEQLGYQWMTFNNDWNVTGQSGDKDIDLTFPQGLPDGILIYGWNSGTYPAVDGDMWFSYSANRQMTGQYLRTISESTYADYSLSSPSGIGITGTITKTVGGQTYTNLAGIYNAVTKQGITTQSVMTSTDMNVSTIRYPSGIYVGIKSPLGVWYNSSTLFSGTGIPTPTVTPTPVPTVAPGYVRTTVAAWDMNGNRISEVNINIYDIEAAVWKNSTEDTDGIEYIDTLPYHTLNIYGSYTVHPNVYTDAELLGMETGYYGNYYYLTLFPYGAVPPGAGNTNLYIQVLENINKNPVPGVFLQVSFAGNATIGVYTNNAGVQVVTVPNNTFMSITATKAGWLGNVVTIDSGPGPTSAVSIGIDRAYITPTPTITAGSGGVIPTTYLPGIGPTSSAGQISKAQDNEMMNKIRTAGPYLIDLAILATMMGLLYLIMGKK